MLTLKIDSQAHLIGYLPGAAADRVMPGSTFRTRPTRKRSAGGFTAKISPEKFAAGGEWRTGSPLPGGSRLNWWSSCGAPASITAARTCAGTGKTIVALGLAQ
jgi:hypothetical protein